MPVFLFPLAQEHSGEEPEHQLCSTALRFALSAADNTPLVHISSLV